MRSASMVREDLEQEARIGLLLAKKRFRPEKGRWSTFAVWTMRGTVLRALNRAKWGRGKDLSHAIVARQIPDGWDCADERSTPPDVLADSRIIAERVRRWMAENEAMGDLIRMRYFERMTTGDIAKRLKKSRAWVDLRLRESVSVLASRFGAAPGHGHYSIKRIAKEMLG